MPSLNFRARYFCIDSQTFPVHPCGLSVLFEENQVSPRFSAIEAMPRLSAFLALLSMTVMLLLSGVAQASTCKCVQIWKKKKNGKGSTRTISDCGDFLSYQQTSRGWPYSKYKLCCLSRAEGKACYRESKRRDCGGQSWHC